MMLKIAGLNSLACYKIFAYFFIFLEIFKVLGAFGGSSHPQTGYYTTVGLGSF